MLSRNSLILAGVAAAAFMSPFTQTAYTPSLVEMAADFGVSTLLVNLTISIFVIIIAVGGFVLGPLSDRHGRRRVLLAGLACYLAGSLVCLLAGGYGVFMAGRVLQAIGAGAGITMAAVVIGDIYPPAQRGQAMSVFQLMTFLGPVVGPVAGGLIAAYLAWQWVFALLVAAGALVLVYNLIVLPETLPPDAEPTRFSLATFGGILADRSAMAILLAGFSQFYGQYTFLVFLPVLLGSLFGFSPAQTGLVYVPMTAGILAGILLANRLGRYWPRTRTVTHTTAVMAAAVLLMWLLLIAGALSLPLLVIVLLVYGVMLGGSLPAQSTILVNLFSADRGSAVGLYNSVRFTGAALGPVLGGLLAGVFGYQAVFAMVAMVLAIAAVFVRRHIHDPFEGSSAA